MAARLNKLHQEDIRKKIQASQLINVLQDHALTGESEISPSRMKAIEILLRKSVADLSSIELNGEMDHRHTLVETLKAMKDNVAG